MDLKIDTVLTDRNNAPIVQGDSPLTLGEVIESSLLFDNPSDKHEGTERYRRYKLQQKVQAAVDGKVDLSTEERATIKKCVGQSYYTTWIVGRVFDLIEAGRSSN